MPLFCDTVITSLPVELTPRGHHNFMQSVGSFGKVVFQAWSSHQSPCGAALLISRLYFINWGASLSFSFRSSWPDQQGDPNLPRARRTSMKTTKACPTAVPWTTNMPMWICKTFSTCLFKAQPFGLFCSNSHVLAVLLSGSRIYGWHCLLFMFLVPNKRHLLSCVCFLVYFSLKNRI